MKRASLLVALLVAIPVCAQSTGPKDAPIFKAYPEFMWAEGVLRADNLTEETELPFDTVTRIECYKHGGQLLADSDAYCLEASAGTMLGMPTIDITYLPVKSWGSEMIVAADSPSASMPICVWTQLTINLREKSVMVTDIKKTGKGHEGFNNSCEALPLSQTYLLIDTVSEMTRRRIRAAEKRKSSK